MKKRFVLWLLGIYALFGVTAAAAYVGQIVFAPQGQPPHARYSSQIIELGIDNTDVPCVTVVLPGKGVGLSCDWSRADRPKTDIIPGQR